MMEGANLIKGVDAGGVRWFLDGKPVHAGTELEILLELHRKFDHDTGKEIDFTPHWVPVRLEFDFRDGKALAYWPTRGNWEMFSEVKEGVIFRWPRNN